MIKLTVLYGAPEDAAAFEEHYGAVHLPLVRAMPGLRRFEAARVLPGPDGASPPFYRVAELWFDSPEALQVARETPEGRAPAEDVPNFASGGATVMTTEVDLSL